MTEMLVLMLPSARRLAADAAAEHGEGRRPFAPYWAKIAAGCVTASGVGDGWRAAFGDGAIPERVLALAPASDAPVRFVAYDNLAPAQAAAVARVDAVKHLLGNPLESHVASGMPSDIGQSFAVAVTQHDAMRAWHNWLAAQGLTPDAILPIAAMLPPPDGEGLTALACGEELVMRSAQHGYASDAAIDALLGGEAAIQAVTEEEWHLALTLAVQHPPVDLLSGAWQRKAAWQWDRLWLRLAKILAVLLVLLSLSVPLVQTVKYHRDTKRADRELVAAAENMGITAPDAATLEAEIDRRLAMRVDGPLAFSVPASALYAAIADAPDVTLKQLHYRSDGTLTATLASPRHADLDAVVRGLKARGYHLSIQPLEGGDSQPMMNLMIRAVP
jgi:general secretion pathway protein L